MAIFLFAPESYWKAKPDRRAQVCNGCGSKGAGWLIPDRFFGLDLSEACNIHDWMYAHSKPTQEAKDEADVTFLNNMVRIINGNTTNPILRWLRLRRARQYYWAVYNFGGPSFWCGKNDEKSLGMVEA